MGIGDAGIFYMFNRKVVLRLVAVLGIAYLGIAMLLHLAETKIVFPAPPVDDYAWDPAAYSATETWIDTADGAKVHAWLFAHPSPKATLIYSHGNAESICFLGELMQVLRDYWQVNVVVYDYRGYGKTGGAPSEMALENDAMAVGNWVKSNAPWRFTPIIAMGRSMGGFPATVMASHCKLDGLILDRTFSSIEDVASYRFAILPVRWFLSHKMRSQNWIEKYNGPLLQMHGEIDEVIPFVQGKKLFDACPSTDKEFLTFESLSHNQPLPRSFLEKANQFIDRIEKSRVGE